MYETIAQVFTEALPKRFRAEEAKNQKARYEFQVEKAEEIDAWTVIVDDGNLSINEGIAQEPNCVLKITEQDYLDMVNGRESIQMLYMTGKLRVEGDLTYAVKLARFFPAEKKK